MDTAPSTTVPALGLALRAGVNPRFVKTAADGPVQIINNVSMPSIVHRSAGLNGIGRPFPALAASGTQPLSPTLTRFRKTLGPMA